MFVPELKKFEIKYGCAGFEEGNNFLHRNFSRFEMDCKWKFREFSRLNLMEFNKISSWFYKFEWNLDKILVFAPSGYLSSWRRVWSLKFNSKLNQIHFDLIKISLTKALEAWLSHKWQWLGKD
jgi:hypothetical protein